MNNPDALVIAIANAVNAALVAEDTNVRAHTFQVAKDCVGELGAMLATGLDGGGGATLGLEATCAEVQPQPQPSEDEPGVELPE